MGRETAFHFLVEKGGDRRVVMACGSHGRMDWGGEYTTMNGIEARLMYTEHKPEVTCKRCLANLAKAAA